MESEFKLETEVQNDILIMHTFGYINNAGGEQIAQEFNPYFDKGIKKVIIDLKESKVVNSIGISFLIEVIEKLNENGGKLIFANLEPAIDKTLTIMGLFSFAEKSETVAGALKAFK